MESIEKTPSNSEIKIVHFNEELTPFLLTKETEKMSRGELTTYYNSFAKGIPIELEIQDGIRIPFFIKASPSNTFKLWTITPFDPEIGYQIDQRDLTFEGRKKKLKDLISLEEVKLVALPKAPLWFKIDSVNRNNLKKALCEKTGGESKEDKIPQEILDILKGIRVAASFPNGRFVSEPLLDLPWKDDLGLDVILDFNSFYPEDTGPLPATGHLSTADQYGRSHLANILCEKGIAIYLPDKPEKLSQIRMSFFLADERGMKKAY